ncbi:MAG: DUF2779 domain-containing protein, partial [Syntrophales bacterium LBB04]|nr:DUF2779 domain-containing protein [Syntrophales bacterium LBB04]
EGQSHQDQLDKTKVEIDLGAKVIYEATFSYEGLFVKADILRRNGGEWELYEVKSATGLSDVYLDDLAFQYYVLKGVGLPVTKAFLAHINNQYTRNGAIEADKLFFH